MSKTLTLNLDSLWEDSYIYTEYDIGGNGHSITINEEDKEAFLDAFAQEWRNRAEEALEEDEEEEDQELIEALEEERLFVLCKNNVEDDEGLYCIQGKEYRVIDIQEDVFTIETEDEIDEMSIPRNDLDFEIIIK